MAAAVAGAPVAEVPLPRPPSQKALRALLRASPLIAPDVRSHWLRVLPHLSGAQRAELAQLLASETPPAAPAPDAPARA